eukprot:RCo019576
MAETLEAESGSASSVVGHAQTAASHAVFTTLCADSHVHVEWAHLDLPKFVCASVAVYLVDNWLAFPLWVVKVRQQCYRGEFPSARTVVQRLYRELGLRGFYRGYFVA